MEEEKVLERFLAFLEEYYKENIILAANEGKNSVEIDFSNLEKFDFELAEYFLEYPEEVLKKVENSLGELEPSVANKNFRLRFYNLPESRNVRIRNLRAEHIGKFLVIDGIVKRASEVRPEVYETDFQCSACGEIIKVTLDEERSIKMPQACPNCGNRKGFKVVSEKFYDTRWIVIEEPFEITSGERPSDLIVYLKEDLVTPRMQYKTDPGNRIKVAGILKKLPRRVKGSISRQMEIYLDANYVESVETEWEEIEISEEDEKKIVELAKDPQIYDKVVASIAPSIFGLDDVKLAIALQLFGGVEHVQQDKSRVRGEIHILLVGEPSCLVGDERVILGNGAIVKIGQIGKQHLEKINLPVYLAKGYERGTAKVFHKYEFQPVIEIVTESGKSIKGTFNQPVLVKVSQGFGKRIKEEWKRLDEIKIGDEIRVINWIPCSIKRYVETGWEAKISKNAKEIKVPKLLDEKLASILGYLLADGYVQKYRVGCVFNYEELDLLPKLEKYFLECFDIKPRLDYRNGKSGTNVEMVFNSVMLSKILEFLKEKRVPDLIFRSKNSVVASFLSWLYDGNGSVIAKGRGKSGIFYKSKEIELLRDIQVLLLRFGIHSRIYGNNLVIRQAKSIRKFAKFIGFNSEKKGKKLGELLKLIENYKHERHNKRWEKIVKIIYHAPETVYDIEVPKYHRFVSNGIVCHNTAKTSLMNVVTTLMPRARYVSGKGITGVGITATVTRDEELFGGWVLEAGALVLCNKSLLAIDEFEKMDKQDMIALHEAMESGKISIAKANIVATLPAKTSILAGGNPKLGRFDPYIPIKEQLDVPETILSRFDLKFALRDVPNPEIDERIASHILEVRHFKKEEVQPIIPPELFRKYVAYARKNCFPQLTEEAAEEIKKFFLELRKRSVEGAPIAITVRQYEALIRLAEASAKIQLRDKVNKEDALRAIRLMSFSLRQFGFEPETGELDIDRAEGAKATAVQRSKIRTVVKILEDLEALVGKEIPEKDIIDRAKASGIEDIEEILRKMKQEGLIYSPKPGFISKV